MGSDPQAILYYGIELGSEDPMDGEEEVDYHGANDSWAKDRRPKEPDNESFRGPEWDQWRADLKVYEATPQYVEFDWSGAEACKKYYVHCPCYEENVEWDDQIDFGHELHRESHPDADETIRQFCERFGIEYKRPSWHLAVRYF